MNTTSTRHTVDEDLSRPATQRGWRVVDIVVTAVLGVAMGFVFYAYNGPGYALWETVDKVTPGFAGLLNGIWLLGGVVGGAVIRKPGAAVLTEVLAASVSAAMGTIWGWETIWIGIAQGIGVEIVLAIFLYRRFGAAVLALAGVASGIGCAGYTYVTGGAQKGFGYNLTYFITTMVSGAVLAGLLGWLLVWALAATGALNNFAAGRQRSLSGR